MATLTIQHDLTISIGKSRTKLSPSEGLDIAEELARKSFRRALTQEAERSIPGFDPEMERHAQ